MKGNAQGSWLHPNKALMRGGAEHRPNIALTPVKLTVPPRMRPSIDPTLVKLTAEGFLKHKDVLQLFIYL